MTISLIIIKIQENKENKSKPVSAFNNKSNDKNREEIKHYSPIDAFNNRFFRLIMFEERVGKEFKKVYR